MKEEKNGQHRNAPAPLHGGAAQGTSSSAGSSFAQIANATPAAIAAQYAQQARASAGLNPYPVPRPKLPRADPVVGEIAAWRAWALAHAEGCKTLLTSVYRTVVVWRPQETLVSPTPTDYGDIGIHAHKTRETLLKYVGEAYSTKLLVVGRVRLWGEVVEGETGYRAEFAQIESLEEILRPKFADCWKGVDWFGEEDRFRFEIVTKQPLKDQVLLNKLREVYGVN